MATVTRENAKLELRRDDRGRFKLLFDGQHVPGVVDVVMSQEGGLRPEFHVTFAGAAIRMVEQSGDTVDCGGDE